ncbi:MAG: hypothetical protein N2645_18580 [Clostridia bacterium]|nr:hypothetical protein [Clostridia bacterium]
MFKGKLEKFILRRVVILFAVLAILTVFLFKDIYIFFGLLLGTGLSIFRFLSMAAVFSRLMPESAKPLKAQHGVFRYVLNQVITVLFLIIAIAVKFSLFAGMAVGIMTVPIVVMVNSITEFFKLSNNNFE